MSWIEGWKWGYFELAIFFDKPLDPTEERKLIAFWQLADWRRGKTLWWSYRIHPDSKEILFL